MAAGLGFKTFTTGEVLTAADVNGYLMQGVLVFASEAARDAAITSPQEGQFAYTKDNNSLWYYTGSAWAASGATGDIEGVTAGTGISGGGTSGTVTITNSMATAIDAKGDLVVGTGADTFSRLAVGTNGHTLVADSSVSPTGLKWAAPSSGAMVKISNTTFSNVATQDFDGVFTSTYKDYWVVINSMASATNTDILYMRLKYGVNVQASQYYNFRATFLSTATSTSGGMNQIEIGKTGDTGGTPKGTYNIYLHNIDGTAQNPAYFGEGVEPYSYTGSFFGGGWQGTPTAFDGFRLLSSATNITGDVTIYGIVR